VGRTTTASYDRSIREAGRPASGPQAVATSYEAEAGAELDFDFDFESDAAGFDSVAVFVAPLSLLELDESDDSVFDDVDSDDFDDEAPARLSVL
jgi:hypothetical protein